MAEQFPAQGRSQLDLPILHDPMRTTRHEVQSKLARASGKGTKLVPECHAFQRGSKPGTVCG